MLILPFPSLNPFLDDVEVLEYFKDLSLQWQINVIFPTGNVFFKGLGCRKTGLLNLTCNPGHTSSNCISWIYFSKGKYHNNWDECSTHIGLISLKILNHSNNECLMNLQDNKGCFYSYKSYFIIAMYVSCMKNVFYSNLFFHICKITMIILLHFAFLSPYELSFDALDKTGIFPD